MGESIKTDRSEFTNILCFRGFLPFTITYDTDIKHSDRNLYCCITVHLQYNQQ